MNNPGGPDSGPPKPGKQTGKRNFAAEKLGFERGYQPTPEEAKVAWKQAVKKSHPDTNPGDPSAAERFRDINLAYQKLKDQSGERKPTGREREDLEDETLEKLVAFVERCQTIEELLRVFDFFDMYSADQLTAINLPERIDNQAIYIFRTTAKQSKTKAEARQVLDAIAEYAFYTTESRVNAVAAVEEEVNKLPEGPAALPAPEGYKVDHEARKAFLKRIREVEKYTELEALLKELYESPHFDKKDISILRPWITRKERDLRPR